MHQLSNSTLETMNNSIVYFERERESMYVPWNFSSRVKIPPVSLTVMLGFNACIAPFKPITPTVISNQRFLPSQESWPLVGLLPVFLEVEATNTSSVSMKGSNNSLLGDGFGISIIPCGCGGVQRYHKTRSINHQFEYSIQLPLNSMGLFVGI